MREAGSRSRKSCFTLRWNPAGALCSVLMCLFLMPVSQNELLSAQFSKRALTPLAGTGIAGAIVVGVGFTQHLCLAPPGGLRDAAETELT